MGYKIIITIPRKYNIIMSLNVLSLYISFILTLCTMFCISSSTLCNTGITELRRSICMCCAICKNDRAK